MCGDEVQSRSGGVLKSSQVELVRPPSWSAMTSPTEAQEGQRRVSMYLAQSLIRFVHPKDWLYWLLRYTFLHRTCMVDINLACLTAPEQIC